MPGDYIGRNYFGNTYKITKKELEEKCILINSNDTFESSNENEENKEDFEKDHLSLYTLWQY